MDWKQCTKPPAVIKHPTMPGVLILVKEDEVLPCPPEEEDQVFHLAEEVLPCPHYKKYIAKALGMPVSFPIPPKSAGKKNAPEGPLAPCGIRTHVTCFSDLPGAAFDNIVATDT